MALKRRIVIVGLGSIGRRHTRLLCERGDVILEIMESCDRRKMEVLNELGDLRAHHSYESMLSTSPDVVWIATPTPLHAEQTIAALNAGAHVFCEKPMSQHLSDALRMKEAADDSNKVLNIGFYLHFWPAMIALRRLIQEGELGRVLHAHAWVGSYVTLVNSQSRYQAEQPGSLFFDYSHQPDLFYWLLGEKPSSVHVTAFQGGSFELTSNPNMAVITFGYKCPLVSTIHLNYAQMPDRHQYEIVGDEGWAFVDFHEGILKIGKRRQQRIETQTLPCERDDIFRAEHSAFLETVAGAREPETSAADGLVSTELCEAALKSWQTGQTILVGI